MKDIRFFCLKKFNNKSAYAEIDAQLYKNLKSGAVCTALSCVLEAGENERYPLEDLLDEFYLNCTDDFVISERDGAKTLRFELEGSLGDKPEDIDNLQKVLCLIGKRVYNKTENGRLKLIVE